jgi:hypothetical protein
MRRFLQAAAVGSAAALVFGSALGVAMAQPRVDGVTAEASWAQPTDALPPGTPPNFADQLKAINISLTSSDATSTFQGVCKTDSAKPTSAAGATSSMGGKADFTGLLSGTIYYCFTSTDGTTWSDAITVAPVEAPYTLRLAFDESAWSAIPAAEGWGPMYKAGVNATDRSWTWPIASAPSSSTQLWGALYVKIATAQGFPTKLIDGQSPVVEIATSLGKINFITTENLRALNGGWVADAMLTSNALLGSFLPSWAPFLGKKVGTLTLEKSETPVPVTTPGAVSSLQGKAAGKKGKPAVVTFTWQMPANDGGAAITGYEYVVTVGKTKRPVATTTATRVAIPRVPPGTVVSIEVKAVNSVGAGAPATVRVAVKR